MLDKKPILEAGITNATKEKVLERICSLAHSRQSAYICLSNVHMVAEAYRDPQFRAVLEAADMSLPDGKPLAVSMNLLHGTQQKRIAGPDLMIDLFGVAEKENLSVFLFGST